jgi:hypothetical protein
MLFIRSLPPASLFNVTQVRSFPHGYLVRVLETKTGVYVGKAKVNKTHGLYFEKGDKVLSVAFMIIGPKEGACLMVGCVGSALQQLYQPVPIGQTVRVGDTELSVRGETEDRNLTRHYMLDISIRATSQAPIQHQGWMTIQALGCSFSVAPALPVNEDGSARNDPRNVG